MTYDVLIETEDGTYPVIARHVEDRRAAERKVHASYPDEKIEILDVQVHLD